MTIQSALHLNDGLGDDFVYDLLTDDQGTLWAATDAGIAVITTTGHHRVIRRISSDNGLPDNIVLSLAQGEPGVLWVGMHDGGICSINTTTFEVQVPAAARNWSYGPVNSIIRQGTKLWIATDDHGVLVLDPADPESPVVYSAFNDVSVKRIRSVFPDAEGNIWLISPNALIRSPGNSIGLLLESRDKQYRNIHSILCSNRGSIWFSNDNGLFRIKNKSSIKEKPEQVIASGVLSGVHIISLHEDREGGIWAGTFGKGILRIDPGSASFERFSSSEGLVNDNVLSITGSRNMIWFATLGGASRYLLSQGDGKKNRKPVFESFGELHGLGNNFIYKVFEDSYGRVWFGTDGNGISVWEDDRFLNYADSADLKGKVVYSITEEQNGHTWFTTSNSGVYDFDGRSFRKYDLKQGLSNIHISGLAAGKQGEIYVIHMDGVDMLDPISGRFKYLGAVDGVGALNADLNTVSVDSMSGTIWIGSSRGIITLSADVYNRPARPPVRITGVMVLLEETDTLEPHTFAHNRNHFTFSYSGLWYKAPDQVRYQVMLEGYDLDWISTRNKVMTYSSLAPGTYTFRVKASISDDFSISEERRYTFTIRKPVWKTWWFLTLSSLVVIALVTLIIRNRDRRLRREQHLIRENILSQFETLKNQVNPHFLFNSFSTLSAIITENQDLAQEYVQKLSQFYRNILEYRDKSVITLEEELALAETYAYLQTKRFGPAFSVKINLKKETRSSFIPPLTLQMLLENAVKHNIISSEKPLTVELHEDDGYLVISNPDQPRKNAEPSTGVGLQNIRSRYRILSSKEIRIETSADRFAVYLPILKTSST